MFRRLNGLIRSALFRALIVLASSILAAQPFQISYADDAATGAFKVNIGNDVTLVAVPEPGVLLTLAAGISTLVGLQRFRRRSTVRRRD
jgi:hypothetical protein